MTDLLSLLLTAIEEKQVKAEAARSLTVLLNWPRQNGKATIRAFMDDNDPAAVLRRCAADKRSVARLGEMYAKGPDYFENSTLWELVVSTLEDYAESYGLDIPVEGETT